MSIWQRIAELLKALASGESLASVFERLRTPPERSVAFTIAVISLAAKMAKADGHVTPNEVRAFREVFHIPPGDEAAAARVFNLARQDVAGFDIYAARIGAMFGEDKTILENLLEGLFHIATADGHFHDAEDAFLAEVTRAFGLEERVLRSVRARYVPGAAPDPYAVLGVDPDTPVTEIRARWRQLVRESHPDHLLARGVPEEAMVLANRKLAALNDAWREIQAEARVQ
ncbi:molecular chaperone DjiA [Halovulum dunhuangense]|uniref:Molecular chaperone DjiA n=1 Tax=Halovulum dunhuangense TaxID=1505036 RepID=A0A849L542_9RHOB|nr:molecular chaperone DjiA [Halovulum dunhuangense]NNU81495.1 molecular chaperone DjiA [Halovulum dunhuangense]